MADKPQETPLLSLLSLLTTAIHTIEAELKEAQMPTFSLEPRWHPLDGPDAVPSPRLFEARKVAMASANMIKALVQDVGTALWDMSAGTADTASYVLTADIGLVGVFNTEEERYAGLPVQEMVSRLPDGKKVNPQKLARCLRLLSAEHWWTEPSPGVFAPTRWALLNTPGSPTWAWHDPPAWGSMIGCTAFTEHMTNPATMNADNIESAPFVLGWHKLGNTQDKNWWELLEHQPEKLNRFALAMEGAGYMNIASIKADYPWETLPPNSTFVDVGSGKGSVALHVLKHVYTKVPTLKVVLQDTKGPLEAVKEYWARDLPAALDDGRMKYEVHDFFNQNPRTAPNTVYWLRWIMHDWPDRYAIQILKQIRAVCHVTSRVLLADFIMLEAVPSQPQEGTTLKDTLDAIDNNKAYEPCSASYPLPQNFGFATKVSNLSDMFMLIGVNGQERTLPEFENIIDISGFTLSKVYPTRGHCAILELVPNFS